MNNSNTNSAIQILTSAEARNRSVRWELIKARNAHYVWHPRCIDAALNSTYDGSSWGGLCGTAVRKAGLYEIYTECYKSIQELALILYRKDTSLRDLFLRTKAASVQHVICGSVKNPCINEEVENILRSRYFKVVSNYSPVGKDDRGRFFTQGFEAFITSRIRTVWKGMKQALVHYRTQSLEAMQEGGWEIAAPESLDHNVRADERTIILGALAGTINDVRDWEMFHALAYGSETVRSYALRVRSSKSTISCQAQLILERLKAKIGGIIPTGKRAVGDIGQVTRLIGLVVSEEEFLRAVPPPMSANLNGEMAATDHPPMQTAEN